jgi:hypothetical protein
MIKIDVGMMGSEWDPDTDSLAMFAEELASVTGRRVALSSWGNSEDISESDWNKALDNYHKRIGDNP